jgi:hypothetical protein
VHIRRNHSQSQPSIKTDLDKKMAMIEHGCAVEPKLKDYDSDLFRPALEAIKGQKTMFKLASEYEGSR